MGFYYVFITSKPMFFKLLILINNIDCVASFCRSDLSPLETVLMLTPMLERSLSDVLATIEPGKKTPSLMRDLVSISLFICNCKIHFFKSKFFIKNKFTPTHEVRWGWGSRYTLLPIKPSPKIVWPLPYPKSFP